MDAKPREEQTPTEKQRTTVIRLMATDHYGLKRAAAKARVSVEQAAAWWRGLTKKEQLAERKASRERAAERRKKRATLPIAEIGLAAGMKEDEAASLVRRGLRSGGEAALSKWEKATEDERTALQRVIAASAGARDIAKSLGAPLKKLLVRIREDLEDDAKMAATSLKDKAFVFKELFPHFKAYAALGGMIDAKDDIEAMRGALLGNALVLGNGESQRDFLKAHDPAYKQEGPAHLEQHLHLHQVREEIANTPDAEAGAKVDEWLRKMRNQGA